MKDSLPIFDRFGSTTGFLSKLPPVTRDTSCDRSWEPENFPRFFRKGIQSLGSGDGILQPGSRTIGRRRVSVSSSGDDLVLSAFVAPRLSIARSVSRMLPFQWSCIETREEWIVARRGLILPRFNATGDFRQVEHCNISMYLVYHSSISNCSWNDYWDTLSKSAGQAQLCPSLPLSFSLSLSLSLSTSSTFHAFRSFCRRSRANFPIHVFLLVSLSIRGRCKSENEESRHAKWKNCKCNREPLRDCN